MADAVRQQTNQGSVLGQLTRELRAVRTQGWGNPWGYAFVAPALTLYLIFNVWPIFRGLAMAFTNYRYLVPGSSWAWNGISNFQEMFTNDQHFWPAFAVSVKYSILYFPTEVIVSFLVAILISRIANSFLAGTYRVIAYLPVVLPISVALILWTQLYNLQFGYFNLLLTSVFGVQNPPNWLGSPHWALPSLVVANVWKQFGGDTLLFLVGVYGISHELYEAAQIDGAGALRQIWSITLPLLRPVFLLVVVLNTSIISATEQPLIMTQGGPENATLTLGLYLYQQAFQEGDLRLGYAAAMSLFLGIISMILAAIAFKLLRTDGI